MREPGDIVAAFPRPGRVLKTILAVLAAFAIAGAVIVNWAPGGEQGAESAMGCPRPIDRGFTCSPPSARVRV